MTLSLVLAFVAAFSATPIFALDSSDAARGVRLYNDGRYAESRAVLERVAEEGLAGPLELTVLGMAHTMLGEYDRAEIVLARAESLDPFAAVVHIAWGTLAFQQGDYGSAYESFGLAMRFAPDSPQAREGLVASLANLAITNYESGDLQACERQLVTARSLDAANPALIEMLIEVRSQLGRTDSLADLYRDLVRVQPENGDAFARLGMILEAEGDEAAAREAFRDAERLVTELPYPYLSLARHGLAHGAPQSLTISRLHSAVGKAIRESDRIRLRAVSALD
ncbi:MAG TPA: tetratricopeptide repeat protein [Spirochaetia bacterium]|nr:tetratricopeptide repeat protein [Spirochaetia bacterium]